MSLPASRQHIEVRKEGFNAFVTDLVLAPGIARTVDFKLVNPKDVAGNSPQTIRTKSGIRLLIVAGGVFQAGTDRREQGRRPNEGAHKVTLLRPFYMGEREVTNAQFRQFRATHNSGRRGRVIARSRQTTRVARHLGRSRGILQLAVGAGRPAAGVRAAAMAVASCSSQPVSQWLPAADRSRVGVRGARREHRQAAQVSLGRGSARGVGHRQRRRQRSARVVRRRHRGPSATNFPRSPRRRCSRRMRSASTTSPATCPSGSTIVTCPSCLPARSRIRWVPTTARAMCIAAPTGAPWPPANCVSRGAKAPSIASDVIGFRVARYVAPE